MKEVGSASYILTRTELAKVKSYRCENTMISFFAYFSAQIASSNDNINLPCSCCSYVIIIKSGFMSLTNTLYVSQCPKPSNEVTTRLVSDTHSYTFQRLSNLPYDFIFLSFLELRL